MLKRINLKKENEWQVRKADKLYYDSRRLILLSSIKTEV